jgi:hypothetical protein
MGSVAGAREVNHAVKASVGCAITLVSVRIQLLLGENITAVLGNCHQLQCISKGGGVCRGMRAEVERKINK